jgi:ABC-type Fe3+-hydroxamate transport system substrate-binding protein
MTREFIDQLGRIVSINYPPKRIISLVPSQTELLFDLGLDQEVIGITKFCVHPAEKFRTTIKVGGTKKLKLDVIRALKPDLIIGNKEENSKEDVEALSEEFPVWMSDIFNLEDAMITITQIAELVDRLPEASYLNHLILGGFTDLQTLAVQMGIDKTVAYVIWKDPYMLAGKNTFINDLLTKIGLQNIAPSDRYPSVEGAELLTLKPELVMLSSEPYPFKQQHISELNLFLPQAKVLLVDGEMFSWYGSRLVKAVQYLFQLQKELI